LGKVRAEDTMRVLIFGGAGFIGSNLVRQLYENGTRDILVADNLSMGNKLEHLDLPILLNVGDMTSSAWVQGLVREFKPTSIYHLAANSDISASVLDPSLDIYNSLISTINLSYAIRNSPVQELVFSSSSAVFGNSSSVLTENSKKRPTSAYGWMKLSSELILKSLFEEGFVSKYLCVRFPNVTGELQTHGVVHDLVRKLTTNSKRLEVLGDGSQLKPYVYVTELVEAINSLIDAPWDGFMTVNLGPVDQTSVSEIVDALLDISGLSPDVVFGTSRSGWEGDVPEYKFDLSVAREILGKVPFGSSADAIRRSITWELKKDNGQS
jgi:UDP-glucose 4-epimerase